MTCCRECDSGRCRHQRHHSARLLISGVSSGRYGTIAPLPLTGLLRIRYRGESEATSHKVKGKMEVSCRVSVSP